MTYSSNDVQGLSCLITGATNGIGVETARELFDRGAKLTVLCRSESKGNTLREALGAGPEQIDLLLCDMTSLTEVRQAAQQYLDSGKPLDLLVNNAGVVNTERRLSQDGYEEMLAVNHLAPFLLTTQLLPLIEQSDYARIVNVASHAHHFVKGMGFDDLQLEKKFKTFGAYGRSKLANMLFTRELAQRLADSKVTVNAVHPGAVSTGLGTQNKSIFSSIAPLLLKPFFKTPAQGAQTSLYVALAQELDGVSGQYYANCKPSRPKPWAQDDAAAKKLWQLSEEMTAVKT